MIPSWFSHQDRVRHPGGPRDGEAAEDPDLQLQRRPHRPRPPQLRAPPRHARLRGKKGHLRLRRRERRRERDQRRLRRAGRPDPHPHVHTRR